VCVCAFVSKHVCVLVCVRVSSGENIPTVVKVKKRSGAASSSSPLATLQVRRHSLVAACCSVLQREEVRGCFISITACRDTRGVYFRLKSKKEPNKSVFLRVFRFFSTNEKHSANGRL